MNRQIVKVTVYSVSLTLHGLAGGKHGPERTCRCETCLRQTCLSDPRTLPDTTVVPAFGGNPQCTHA
jgi:hypothetical protein